MFHQACKNDVILLSCLGYVCADIMSEWENFSTCNKPVHKWLLASCACALSFRLLRLLGSWACSEASSLPGPGDGASRPIGGRVGDSLMDIGHKGWLPKMVATFTWAILVPFFVAWNFLGTLWLREVLTTTPDCFASETHVWFSIVWLLLTYLWLAVHIGLALTAKRLQLRVQRTETNLVEVEDAETVARWGHVSRTAGTRSLAEAAGQGQQGGLSPAAIKRLPTEVVAEQLFDCSICLTDMNPGETVRCLPNCGHKFHKCCIDLWLVRQAQCPLCKQTVEEHA